jgi:putative transposase
MRKTFKYSLYPTDAVEQKLVWTVARCRELYNAALTERRDAYTFHVKQYPNFYDEPTRKQLTKELHIGYYEQQNALPELKAEIREEYQDIAAHVLQDVLRRLDRAFQAFFRRVKNGENPGYPRILGRNRYDSFTYPDGAGWKCDGWYLHLSKIGSIKVRLHRPLEGNIKTVTIKR